MPNPEIMEMQKRAILKAHGATACHVETVRIRKVIGKVVWWDGDVEIYEITGHPEAKRCYALNTPVAGYPMTTTVLQIPPVDSPQAAVKSVIVGWFRDARKSLREGWPD
jgi:hypothetical protein